MAGDVGTENDIPSESRTKRRRDTFPTVTTKEKGCKNASCHVTQRRDGQVIVIKALPPPDLVAKPIDFINSTIYNLIT